MQVWWFRWWYLGSKSSITTCNMNNYDTDAFVFTEITSDFVYTQTCKMSSK